MCFTVALFGCRWPPCWSTKGQEKESSVGIPSIYAGGYAYYSRGGWVQKQSRVAVSIGATLPLFADCFLTRDKWMFAKDAVLL